MKKAPSPIFFRPPSKKGLGGFFRFLGGFQGLFIVFGTPRRVSKKKKIPFFPRRTPRADIEGPPFKKKNPPFQS